MGQKNAALAYGGGQWGRKMDGGRPEGIRKQLRRKERDTTKNWTRTGILLKKKAGGERKNSVQTTAKNRRGRGQSRLLLRGRERGIAKQLFNGEGVKMGPTLTVINRRKRR